MNDVLEQAIMALAGDAPIERAALAPFSGLDRPAAARLSSLMAKLPSGRQREVVAAMVGEAERSFDLDFALAYRALLEHQDAVIRRLCLEGLAEDTRLGLISPLLSLLEHDRDDTVRAAAASALGRFVYLAEEEELPPHRAAGIHAALERQLTDPATPVDVARRALEALAYINDDVIKAHIDRAYSSDVEAMRLSAVFAMGRSADPAWGDTVMAELHSDNPAMRYEAARACGELQWRDAVEMLSRMIGDRDAEVRFIAVQALGQIGGDAARRVLERLVAAEELELSEAAEEALAEASLADVLFDMMTVDPLEASFQHADASADATGDDESPDEELESFRSEFRQYADEDEDDQWPDEFLTLD